MFSLPGRIGRPYPVSRLQCVVTAGLLLLPLGAWAHLPHQQVDALAVSPDFARDGRALVIEPVDGTGGAQRWVVATTDNGGRRWRYIAGPPVAGVLDNNRVYAAWSTAGPLIGDQLGNLWIDRGGWSELPTPEAGPFRGIAADGDRIVLLAESGLWMATSPDGPWELQPLPGAWRFSLDPVDPDNTLVLTDTDRLMLLRSGALVALPEAPGQIEAFTLIAGTAYAAVDGALLRQAGDGWEPCGPIRSSSPNLGALSVVYVSGDASGRLWAGTGQNLLSSSDRCDRLEEHRPFPQDIDYASTGASLKLAYVGVAAAGEQLVVAGYRGVSVGSDDNWVLAELLRSNVARSIRFSPNFLEDARFWVASYGGGLVWTNNNGVRWTGSAVGLTQGGDAYGRDLAPFGDVLLWAGDLFTSVSLDGGQSFSPATLPMLRVREFEIGQDIWAVGNPADGSALARSSDGVHWTEIFPPTEAWARVREVNIHGEPALVVLSQSDGGLYVSMDRGETFERLEADGEGVNDVVSWPPWDGERLVRSGPTGVRWRDLAGGAWNAAAGPTVAHELEVADDGTLFVADAEARVWRSRDGGVTWGEVHAPVPGGVAVIRAAPGFATAPVVVLGGYGGTRVSVDGGDSWDRLQGMNRVEFPDCTTITGAACEVWADAEAGAGGGVELSAGDTATGSGFAAAVRWLGEGDPPALIVNGQSRGPLMRGVWARLAPPGEVTPAWREIVLVAGPGGLKLDALEFWQDGGLLERQPDEVGGAADSVGPDSLGPESGAPDSVAPDREAHAGAVETGERTGGCGCGPATGGSMWAAGLLLLLARQRRTTG